MLDISIIFRSIINYKDAAGQETITQANLVKNFRALQEHAPEPPVDKAYQILYHYILDHIRACDTTVEYELPSYEIIKKWFEEREGDESVLSILEKIRVQQPYIGQDYRKILKQYKQDLDQLKLEELLVNTEKIAKIGIKESKARNAPILKGIPAALDYFAQNSRKIRAQVNGLKTESQIVSKEDVAEAKQEYVDNSNNQTDVYGITTGLSQIDDKWEFGLQNNELMLVTAFTSQGKTAFSMYMAYRAIFSGFNTSIVSLEQNFKEIRTHMYVKHTCNPIMIKRFPQYQDLIGTIDLKDIKGGRLSPRQLEFYYAAMDDLLNTESYGKLHLWYPPKAKPTISDIEFKLSQVQQDFKALGRDLEFSVIDYISLLGLPADERTKDVNENENLIIKQLKSLCLTFNGNKGLRMISPFQASRKGYEAAKANDGVYELTALSNAHEAERSADAVIALYVDKDWRDEGKVKVSCLKGRRNGFFAPFNAKINYKSLFYTNSNFGTDLDATRAAEQLQRIL